MYHVEHQPTKIAGKMVRAKVGVVLLQGINLLSVLFFELQIIGKVLLAA